MNSETVKTKVVFIKCKEDGEITAIFPGLPERAIVSHGKELDRIYQCYAHIGQHGTAAKSWALDQLLATPEEYAPLLAELQAIGYNVKVEPKFIKWC